jgi:hypothetical protein
MATDDAERTSESLKNPATFQWQGQVGKKRPLRGGRNQSLQKYPAVS